MTLELPRRIHRLIVWHVKSHDITDTVKYISVHRRSSVFFYITQSTYKMGMFCLVCEACIVVRKTTSKSATYNVVSLLLKMHSKESRSTRVTLTATWKNSKYRGIITSPPPRGWKQRYIAAPRLHYNRYKKYHATPKVTPKAIQLRNKWFNE